MKTPLEVSCKLLWRVDLLEGFLQSNLGTAKFSTLHLLGRCGPEGVPVITRVLEQEPDGELLDSALRALNDSANPYRGRELAVYLGRAVAYLRAEAPKLQAGWAAHAEAPRDDQLRRINNALGILSEVPARDCARPVHDLCALYRTLPPSGAPWLDNTIARAEALVDAR